MLPAFPTRTLPVPQLHGQGSTFVAITQPDMIPQAENTNEILVTYVNASGEEECAVVGIDESYSYEEILGEACLNLAPWLPPDWQDRHRDFAREVRNRKGDIVWAAIQPSLVVELVRLRRLPELRLRVHSSMDSGFLSTQNNLQLPNERSPAYEAEPQQSAVDGIVQAVLHKLFNENFGNLQTPGSHPASEPPMSQDTKARLKELDDALSAAESRAPPLHDTLNSPIHTLTNSPSIANQPATQNPWPASRQIWQPEIDQLPTPQSPPNQFEPWSGELTRPDSPVSSTRDAAFTVPPAEKLSKPTAPIDFTLRASAKSVSEGNHEAAVSALLAACNTTSSPKERAQLYLWLGQISCEIKEHVNANSSLIVARDLFTGLEDRAGRIECEMVLARLDHLKDSGTLRADSRLRELLAEAKRHHLKHIEIKLLCEICQLACATKNISDDLFLLSERAKISAQQLGDLWLKAEASRTSGMVSEARDDAISALQAYSGALELYRGARSGKAQSPVSPIQEVEVSIQRIKQGLSERAEKPKSRFRRFF